MRYGYVRRTTGKRHERQTTGISARQQRRRRVASTFPAQFGTRRGERKMLGALRRSEVYVGLPGDRFGVVDAPAIHQWMGVRRGVTAKPANRAERRWLERYWAAEEEVR